MADGFVHTVEGNAGSPSAVRACRYVVGGRNIMGYGRPDWPLVPEDKPEQPDSNGKDDDNMTYYKTINDVPSYYRAAVEKCVKDGSLKGTGNGEINVSEDLCRMLTIFDRKGKLD